MRTHAPLPSNSATPWQSICTYSTRLPTFVKGLLPFALALAFGALTALAWPPTEWLWALPLGWLGLTASIHAAEKHPFNPIKQGAGVGFFVGIGLYAVLIQWMVGLHPLTWTGLSVLGSWGIVLAGWGVWALLGGVAMASVGAGWAWLLTSQRFQRQALWVQCITESILVGGLWVIAPKLMASVTDVFIPWASVVDATLDRLLRLPSGEWLLTHGGIACTEWAVAVLLTLLGSTVFRTEGKARWAIAIGWVIFLCVASFLPQEAPNTLSSGFSSLPTTTIVQANLPIEVIRSTTSRQWQSSAYESWLRKQHPKANSLFILPEEGILHGVVAEDTPAGHDGVKRLTQWAKAHNVTVAFGGTSSRQTPKSKQYFNSLMVLPNKQQNIQQNKQPVQFYQKRSLVPFGETIPQWLRGVSTQWQRKLLYAVGFPYIPQLESGSAAALLRLSSTLLAAPLICFEVVFPELLPDPKNHPYQAIVVVTNLGWMHHHPALAAQYLQKARVLAVSHQLPVLIAANTGPSAIIDTHGIVLCHLSPNTSGTLHLSTSTSNGIMNRKHPPSPLCKRTFHPIR